jgi:hypothetical protein
MTSFSVKGSLHWKTREEVEWSLQIETELSVKSRDWFWKLVAKNDAPSLVSTVVSWPPESSLTFNIRTPSDIDNLLGLSVDDVFTLDLV